MDAVTIFVISGGEGASGERLARTALAQFGETDAHVQIHAHVRMESELEAVMAKAAAAPNPIVLHTMVNAPMRTRLMALAARHGLVEIDAMGDLLAALTHAMDQVPLGQPGLYRKLREQDLKRIEAIEFTLDHDDGKRIEDLELAEIVLIGVSRVGKTPLSVYLSTLGWKTANVPLAKELPAPRPLFEVERERVIGLTMEPGQLIGHRQRRGEQMGRMSLGSYTAPESVAADLDFARSVFRRGGFATVDMTDKPVEESAQEIIRRVSRGNTG